MRTFKTILAVALVLGLMALGASSAIKYMGNVQKNIIAELDAMENSPEPTPEATPEATAEPTPEATPVPETTPIDNQIKVILNNRQLWEHSEAEDITFFYAITDLDNNGRFEVFSAATDGIAMNTMGSLCEVSEDMTQLLPCTMPSIEGSLPEVIMSKVSRYTNVESGKMYYLFTDTKKNGMNESYEAYEALSLVNGTLEKLLIAYKNTAAYVDGTLYTDYRSGYMDEVISEDQYLNSPAVCFNGFNSEIVSIGWFSADSGSYEAMMPLSYKVFTGELPAMP